MNTKQASVGATSVHFEITVAKASSLDDAGQTQEPQAGTGSLGLGAFDASRSRVVQFTENNLDTGATLTTITLDIADNRPEQNRHRTDYITVPSERIPMSWM